MDNINQETLQRWIVNYLEGNASEEETALLESWVKLSEENKKHYQQLKNIWEVTYHKISNTIHIEDAFEKVLNRIDKPSEKRSLMFLIQRIAAILILPLMLSGIFVGKYLERKSATVSVSYNEIYAAIGTRSTIMLPDGSKVWLNSGSKLRYPDKFVSNKRTVFLTGEAYFQVKSDINRPFIVKTKSLSVKATGTQFNVQALKSESEIRVSLVSGRVLVNNKKENGQEQLLGKLIPNQMFSYDTLTGKSQIFSGDVYEYIAWKEGKLVFRNRPLSEVVKKIGNQYNIDIELKGKKLQDYRYRATFEEESIDEILKLLRMSSPIKYSEVKRTILPNGLFTKRKIVIMPL